MVVLMTETVVGYGTFTVEIRVVGTGTKGVVSSTMISIRCIKKTAGVFRAEVLETNPFPFQIKQNPGCYLSGPLHMRGKSSL